MRIDDLTRIQYVSDAQIAPDGGRVVFVRKVVSKKPGQYETALWAVDVDVEGGRGGEPYPFTAGPRDRHPRWSPDGTSLAFIRAAEKHMPQVYAIGLSGGEAIALTRFPEGSIESFRWSPDGRAIAIKFRPADPEFTDEARRERERRGASDPPRVLNDAWYRLDGDGYFNAQRYELHVIDFESGDTRIIHERSPTGEFSYDFSPDGRSIVLTDNLEPDALLKPWADQVIIVDLDSGRRRILGEIPAGPKCAVTWSPDGRLLAWAGRADRIDGIYSTENLQLWTHDLATGRTRCLTRDEDLCLLTPTLGDSSDVSFAPSIRWTPDGRHLLLRVGIQGEGRLGALPRSGGAIEWLTRGGDVQLGSVSASGGLLALTRTDALSLTEVFLLRRDGAARTASRRGAGRRTSRGAGRGAGQLERLTDLNGELLAELELARPEAHWVESTDGTRVHTWVLRPPQAPRGVRLPAVLQVHGGPHAQYGDVFFHEMQVLAANGYMVFMSNPRGSKGYGRDFCAAIRGAWGTRDWEDVAAVTRFMQLHPSVDPERLAIAGGSYGGFMANWAIGHSDAYRCAITDRCVSNLLSMAGNGDYLDLVDQYWPGAVWDRWEARWEASPIKHFGRVRTPTLVIHSEGDLRCNVEQGEQVFSALQLLGVPSRFVRYPASTSHGMSRGGPPDLRMHRLSEIVSWLNRWLVGQPS